MKEKMEQTLLALMRRPDYRPMNKSELARALSVPSGQRSELRHSLKALEETGTILRAKKGRFTLREADAQTVLGIYRKVSRGGELQPTREDGGTSGQNQSLFIPERHSGTALHGDRVLVRRRRTVEEDPPWLKHLPRDKQERLRERWRGETARLEGEVIKVIERAERPIVGTLVQEGDWAALKPDDPRWPSRIALPDGLPDGGQSGHKALVSIVSWEAVRKSPTGRVLRVLGPADLPGVDILSIIHKHGLATEFSPAVRQEAEQIDERFNADALAKREDWRQVEVITIDPFDARDFDDAIAVQTLEEGGWELAVHIADVSHYVTPGSAIDAEARQRGNSVYLVDRVLPMLPEKLSNGICSLHPDADRLTYCAILRFDAEGRRTASRFASAVIRSRKRLTYEEAHARLQGKGPDDSVTDLLVRSWKLAAMLRKRRFQQGSLDLDFPETKVILDSEGRPTEIRVVTNDESHQLIEEFMLAANEAVAERILQAKRPSLYRIHEDPDADKLLEFRESVLQHGYTIGDLTQRSELQRLLRKLRGQADEPVLKLALLKSLKRAAYSADPRGHYGLAKENYTHFTSPIRRYSDLIVHRVLRRLIEPSSRMRTPSYTEADEIAQHLSTTERTAAEAESETKRLKVLEYFEARSREKPPARLEALVTDVVRMGLFVELEGYGTRGLIRVADLPGEQRYRFEPHKLRFHGGKGQVYQVGDRFAVEIIRVDRERGFIDLRPVQTVD